MTFTRIFILCVLTLTSCKLRDKNLNSVNNTHPIEKKEIANFFPVTSYIKGQIFEIKSGGINPLKLVTARSLTDSTWLKMESLDSELADFLLPEIDTANLASLFTEKKFFDQTLDAITLTYDPVKVLPPGFSLIHWDIYIDPVTNRIRRIYLVKKISGNNIEQLTWIAGERCRLVSIKDDGHNSSIEKDITIKWHF